MRFQHTIASAVMCAGVGVHSGARVRMSLKPAPAGTGIVLVRADRRGEDNRIAAHAAHVTTTRLGTTLANEAGLSIATVEHLLAACAGLEIDNLVVDVHGPEVPILDGSSAEFVGLLLRAGLKPQGAPRRFIRVVSPVEIRSGERFARLEPAEAASFDVTIRFESAAIGTQRKVHVAGRAAFVSEIADARTFGMLAEAEALWAAGLGKGASTDNTIVIDAGRVLNATGLRHEDEFVRHKILDAIGDLSLAGAPIIGRFIGDQPGHAMNVALVKALLAQTQAWRWEVEAAPAEAFAAAAG
jgi:UDP-3-O-[3-hydroxymyristoyl] N-acetylglucosamine deacetylase